MKQSKVQKEIIPPVERELIEDELTKERFVQCTHKGNNEIYIVNHHNSPHTMREIGRLREVSFRAAGGGTGHEIDIDEYDTNERCYEQLIVYNREDQEIIGGYRFITGPRALNPQTGEFELSTAHYFDFSKQMKEEYLPVSIELGRSWVQPEYQPSVNPRKGVFALANIWDGLGALITNYPEIKYFFGKVTMYRNYNSEARDILLAFMAHYFPDHQKLCTPKTELFAGFDNRVFKEYFQEDIPFSDGFKVLHKLLKDRGEWIPPLINIYMNLSSTMMTFGTAFNPDFGGVEETGLLVTIADIHEEVKERHITDYKRNDCVDSE
ncbi:GNAT family N-acetyltransferase [Roseivirga thermotolerans]|uniref:GNAT family N-acetyltransferase n=1 Tax=Roseivirga thermotolerans TaxID=1758176 RepID=UPI00273D7398|nr:GNAT family N-acetyltransferase [Roseivirga thermotolerans]MEC7753282.1 GNAT family N-acyltransferase [Bacteroidota bacterium]